MLSRAALFDGHELLVIDDLEVPDPGPGEVCVRVTASGICHTDLTVLDGGSSLPPPIVLGHEAAGVIDVLGPGVTGWRVGDQVAVTTLNGCGQCRACADGHVTNCPQAFRSSVPALRRGNEVVRRFANVSSLSERVTVTVNQLVAADGLSPSISCLVGCALTTGFGVIHRVVRPRPGDRVAVVGVGGIGSIAIQAAVIAGASVTAIDIRPERENLARRLGAAAFALPADVHEQFDSVVECSGSPAAIEAAIALSVPGGTTALVGQPGAGRRVTIDVNELTRGRRILGSLNGDINPATDLPLIMDHLRTGRLHVEELVSRSWPLSQVGEAIEAMRNGSVVRPIVTFADDPAAARAG
jgi:S-(hydroxymethyl)glutathione dehydrogenase / alcohol dehydrogenase